MGIFKDNKDDKKKKQDVDKPEEEKSMKDLYTASGEMKKKDAKKVSGQAYRVLTKPMVTEKATNLGSSNQYVFMVGIDTNKIEVAKAIQEVYGVKPISVNIIKVKGKKVNRGRITGKRKDFKKAIVTLKKGDTISVYEGV
jgi:large subunit ribosomal protein L23